jgi:hypothetical protein
MKTFIALAAVLLLLSSCARGVSPSDAANNSYKKCRAVN